MNGQPCIFSDRAKVAANFANETVRALDSLAVLVRHPSVLTLHLSPIIADAVDLRTRIDALQLALLDGLQQ